MAYIFPDSIIQFFKRVPLYPGGVDVVRYDTSAQKDAAFDAWYQSNGAGQTTRCSYQRENINRVRVEIPIAQLYTANYLRFKNSSFENKWFYAFVTAINYINNTTTEVIYEIDYFTTWANDFTPSYCYVERQHVEDDRIGVNILEEGIPLGDYVNEGDDQYIYGRLRICMAYWDNGGIAESYTGGVYSAANILETADPNAIEGQIITLTEANRKDDIVQIFMAPGEFINYDSTNKVCRTKTVQKSVTKPYTTIAGYKPKNNKLFVYPYKFLLADNGEGATQEYKYEFFNALPGETSNVSCGFDLVGLVAVSTDVALIPKNYNGEAYNYNVRLGQKQFPQCAYAVDTYKAWLAQNNAWLPQNIAKAELNRAVDTKIGGYQGAAQGAISGAASLNPLNMISGAAVGAASGAAAAHIAGSGAIEKEIKGNLIENQTRVPMPQETHGAISSDIFSASQKKGYYFYKKSIDAVTAKTIDDYFSMFGYKISQNRIFNMKARNYWTYIQTKGCNVGGNLPASDKAVINHMFDRGIRIWVSLDSVGEFWRDNSPRPIN